MFASITTTNANHGSPALRQALLGVAAHSMISGIRFISITPNWTCLEDLPPLVRAFDGGSRQTFEIEQALVARYHASLLDGMDKFEVHGGLRLYLTNNQQSMSLHVIFVVSLDLALAVRFDHLCILLHYLC